MKKKKSNKYETRKDFLLSMYDPSMLYAWFGDDKAKLEDFANKLLKNDAYLQEEENDILANNEYENIYDKKIEKVAKKKHESVFEIDDIIKDINRVKKKIKKDKKRSMKLGTSKDIYAFLYGKRYCKKFLDKDKYRKELKKIAKNEKRDMEEMRKFGYIKSKDINEELKKLEKADKLMESALSDAYTQKYFL